MNNRFGGDPIPGIDSHGSPLLTPANSQIRVLNGPGEGLTFDLHQTPLLIGRHDPPAVTVDIDLTDCELGVTALVSRRHAELQWVEGKLQIVDLCSKNGTFVDGERLETLPGQPSPPKVLRFGSKIHCADLEMEIILTED